MSEAANRMLQAFYGGYGVGESLRKRQQEDLFNKVLSEEFRPYTPEEQEIFKTGAQGLSSVFGDKTPVSFPDIPRQPNMQNVFARLGQAGLGEKALGMQNQMAAQELARMKVLADQWSNPQAGIDPTDPSKTKEVFLQINKLTGQPRYSTASPRPQKPLVEVNTSQPATQEAMKDYMKEMRERYSRLAEAPVALQNIEQAKKLIPAASEFMGPGGGGLLNTAKFLNSRLGTQINVEGVKSAEELRTRIFYQIMENLKKMDASPSQKQQELMQESLGNLGTDPGALARILDSYAEVVRGKIDSYNKSVKDAESRGIKFPYNPYIEMAKQQLQTAPAKPKIGTVTDGYVFNGGDPADPKNWKKVK